MLCSCGRSQVTTLAEKDADQIAIDDLTAQLRDAEGPQRQMLIAKIASLKALVTGDREFERALKRSHKELVANLAGAIELTSADQLLTLPRDQLLDLIVRSGLGLAVDDFISAQDAITEAALDTIQVVIASATQADLPDIDMLKIATADQVFEDIILPDTLSSVRTSLESIAVGAPVSTAMTSLAQRLEQSTGRKLTEVRTQLSSYGRAVTARAAEVYELDHYLYTGPRDGLTRSFCRPLINKVVTSKQMSQLNNGQGLPVITNGGGYNCRHSWSPVTESYIDAAGLKLAKPKDIAKANAGGQR